MLRKTNGIVLRAVKYGETSLIVTVFTDISGTQAYIVQGVRAASARNKAAYFQPGMMLDLVVYAQPNKNLQYVREYSASYIYKTVMDDVVKNAIAMFCTEVLLRVLPESATMPELFEAARSFFRALDEEPAIGCANAPLYFLSVCSSLLGYGLKGSYGPDTPYLDIQEGGFSAHPPTVPPFTSSEDAHALSDLLETQGFTISGNVPMNADMRLRLTDWFIAFMQRHSEHMGNIRSLPILRTILH
ncbi:MAG: DNA repair protein RecO [Taibaiella sp.]|nr:DNA repair protein RecO [Taibaiella sp.]